MACIFQILLRRGKDNNKYNPLLLDLDEGRRWRVVSEVMRRIAAGEAPESCPIREVIALNEEARLKHRIDEVYTQFPFYGAR